MVWRKRRVKRLRTERRDVALKAFGRHERHGSETTNVAVVQGTAVGEHERHGRIATLGVGKLSVVQEERACESRLDDDAVARREIDDDELGAPPRADNAGS